MRSAYGVLEAAGTLLLTSMLVGVGLVSGLIVVNATLTVGRVTLMITNLDGVIALVGFTAFTLLSGVLLLRDVWRPTVDHSEITEGPPLRAIVPVYRDPEVLDISVSSLLASEYEPLAISIVVESEDGPTRRRAQHLASNHDRVECLINGRPGSKAGAINDAVTRSSEPYYAVFDSDEWVAPEFIPRAMGALLEEVDVYQGRRIPRPTGAIETIAYSERIVVQAAYTLFDPLGFANPRSGSTVFSRDAFEAVGGYREMLTEDLAFAHACHDAGLTVREDRGRANTMEAPHSFLDLWGQRKRWRIGQIQVFDHRVRSLLRNRPGLEDTVPLARATGSLIGGLLTLVVASNLVLLALGGSMLSLLPFVVVLGTIAGVWLRDLQTGRIGTPEWTILLVPFIYPVLGVLTAKSFFEYYLTWEGEWYQVTKTGASPRR